MSKPNPAITANLLNSLLEKRGELAGTDGSGSKPKVAAENAAKPAVAKAKLAPNRKTAGAGHMRSSPRGK
jgi:hypothetical protein